MTRLLAIVSVLTFGLSAFAYGEGKAKTAAKQEAGNQVAGYKLLDIKPGSIYDKLGLKNGDILLELNGKPVTQEDIFEDLSPVPSSGKTVVLKIKRNGKIEQLKYSISESSSPDLKSSIPTISPIQNGQLTKGFGIDKNKQMHEGIDIEASAGSDVVSTAPGKVTDVLGHAGSFQIKVKHGNEISTSYLNLQTVVVKNGSEVKRGDKLGALGEKPLFYQVLVKGFPTNPMNYILPAVK
jgi:murein DD-endopeptidase MepM/ murein hydrolase activator NlpD